MILSKKSRYGLRALVDLSVHSKTEHMALNSITVSEIVLALDGSYFVEDEESPAGCTVYGITETLQKMIIGPVNRNLDEVLKNITLEDLERDFTENGAQAQDMYYI